jgi:hypothetical protein
MVLLGQWNRPNPGGREVLSQREHHERSLVRERGDPPAV